MFFPNTVSHGSVVDEIKFAWFPVQIGIGHVWLEHYKVQKQFTFNNEWVIIGMHLIRENA